MIFILLGTQIHPFQRLVQEFTELITTEVISYNKKEIVIQAGSTVVPRTDLMTVYNYMNTAEYEYYLKHADVVITHGGAGSIFDALALHKKVIVLPRLAAYGEHVDDHQVELVEELKHNGYIISEATLAESFKRLPTFHFIEYHRQQVDAIKKLAEIIDVL